MKTSDAIFGILKDYVDTVFYVPGGGAMHLVDSLGRSGLNAVACLHEQGAGYAAIGYAMARNSLGVCLVTSGPGATNAITPCAAAWTDSAPVLFISGQARSDTLIGDTGLRTRGIQEVDIIPMVKGITKQSAQAGTSGKVSGRLLGFLFTSMIETALANRPGPCWLSIPLDVQAEEV